MVVLEAAKAGLKARKHRCSIQLRGTSYALVATLPDCIGSGGKQMSIALCEVNLYVAEQVPSNSLLSSAPNASPGRRGTRPRSPGSSPSRTHPGGTAPHATKYRTSPERGANTWTEN